VAAGAECVYPIDAPLAVLPLLRSAIKGPLNAFATLDGPSPAELGALGATRVTFGPGLLRRTAETLRGIADGLMAGGGGEGSEAGSEGGSEGGGGSGAGSKAEAGTGLRQRA
jgi:2-methylisocitrate lyase-like PEP mutase family enzyme